jgi:cytochrome c
MTMICKLVQILWLAFLLGTVSLPAQESTSGSVSFRKVVIEADCDNPMELAVLPDGRLLFIERFGNVRIWKPDSQSTVLAAKFNVHGQLNPNTNQGADRGSWEAGLLGLTLAPEFGRTGWVYIYYSPAGDTPENRVSRFTLTGDTLDLASEKILLRVPVQREVCCHEAGSLAFDADGNLYVSTGDNTNPFQSSGYNPSDYREGRYAFDAARSAGNADDLRGKILRIHPEPDGSYTVPAGNLFPPGTPRTRPEIYVMGCRNPFRISVDQVTGTLSWGDVGPDAREIQSSRGPAGFDEINRTRQAGNFGWPFLIADNKPYRQYDFASGKSGPPQNAQSPVNHSPNNTGLVNLPPAKPAWLWYPYSPSIRFPLTGSGGRTACAGPFYHYRADLKSDRKLPKTYDGVQFIYEWERGWILAARTDESGAPRLERFAPEVKLKRPVEMEIGPDGALYVIEFGTGWENNKDAQIIRIEPVSGPGISPVSDLLAEGRSPEEELKFYGDCLEGGDAARGRRVFMEKVEVSCARCHKAGAGIQEGTVGPDLSHIGTLRDRPYLLEAIVLPNRMIAEGFETLLVAMKDGREYAGLMKEETDTVIQLESPEDGPLTLNKTEVVSRRRGLSPMPENIHQVLTKDELRDLVEFLSSLK